jgi:hypothetical protein
MKIYLFCFMLLLLACVLPAQAQNVIPGQGHTSRGPAGRVKDVHEMERSPMNVKHTGPVKAADGEELGEEQGEERERARKEFEYNKTQNLQERSKATIFQFDPSKNVTAPATLPGPSGAITTQDPAQTFTGNVQDGSIPSDAQGAAGPEYFVALANGNARIINKLTGAVVSNMTLAAFFINFAGAFDPRIFYDPYGKRFVALALSGASRTCASVDSKFRLLISNNSNPTQGWYYYEFDFDASNAAWLDFARLGFNKDWIVMAGNSICGTARNSVYAFPKASAYAAQGFTFYNWPGIGMFAPAFTYDNALDKEYFVGVGNPNASGKGYIDTKYIAGFPTPSLFNSNSYATSSPWQAFCNSDAELPAQFGSSVKFSFVQTFGGAMHQSCVYRNGSLWAAHPVWLPATGTTTRSATQWWQVSPSTGAVQQVGRIDDGSGTVCTFYPSIAVNRNNDAVISYCIFSPNYYQSAAYNFRNAADPAGTVPRSSFYASGGNVNTSTRTGDYGETVVDPNDDVSIWAVNQISSSTAEYFNTSVTMLPAYYGCYTDVTFGNATWLGNTKNEASSSITSAEMIQPNSNVVYDAGVRVVLSPGFKALAGSKFHAYINGCGGAAPGIGAGTDRNTESTQPVTMQQRVEPIKPVVGLEAFPNPTTSDVTLTYDLKENEASGMLYVFAPNGKLIRQQNLTTISAGRQNMVVSFRDQASGVYTVTLQFGSGKQLSTKVSLLR